MPSDIAPPVQTRRPAGRLPHATAGSASLVTPDRELIARKLNANVRHKTHSGSTESDKDDPVQNLAQNYLLRT